MPSCHTPRACAAVLAFALGAAALPAPSRAETTDTDGPFEIDKRYHYDNHGIWSRRVQLGLQSALILGVTGTALAEGSESRLGRESWRAVDSMLLTAAATTVAKSAFSRSRPGQTPDAGKFFQGNGNRSFPSGEVSNVAAIVTPFVLEYGAEHPSVIAGAVALVGYDAAARMKTQGHWQSDVIAGAALGAGIGWAMHGRETPLTVSWMPGGVFIGWRHAF